MLQCVTCSCQRWCRIMYQYWSQELGADLFLLEIAVLWWANAGGRLCTCSWRQKMSLARVSNVAFSSYLREPSSRYLVAMVIFFALYRGGLDSNFYERGLPFTRHIGFAAAALTTSTLAYSIEGKIECLFVVLHSRWVDPFWLYQRTLILFEKHRSLLLRNKSFSSF